MCIFGEIIYHIYLVQILSEFEEIPVAFGDAGNNLITHPVVTGIHRKINDESLIIKQKFLNVIGHTLCFKGAFKNDETLWDAGVKKVSPKLCLLFNTLVLKLSKVKLHLSEQGFFLFYM